MAKLFPDRNKANGVKIKKESTAEAQAHWICKVEKKKEDLKKKAWCTHLLFKS